MEDNGQHDDVATLLLASIEQVAGWVGPTGSLYI